MRKKFNRYERKQHQERNLALNMAGSGLYVYENNTSGDMRLPKTTASGVKMIGPKGSPTGRFEGDSYYMAWVKLNLLTFVETIVPRETDMTSNKLLLDQPDTVTAAGKVEHFVADPKVPAVKKLVEQRPQPQEDVLLTEEPLDGVEIILG